MEYKHRKFHGSVSYIYRAIPVEIPCQYQLNYIHIILHYGKYHEESIKFYLLLVVLTDYTFPLPCLIFLHKLLIFYMVIIY